MRFVPALVAAILLALVGSVGAASAGATSSTSPKRAIFVANVVDVGAFPLGRAGNISPIAVTTDFAGPAGLARDSNGMLYVANIVGETIAIFDMNANGNVRPRAVIGGPHTRLSYPSGLTVGSDGTIYVANSMGRSGGSVTVYPPLGANSGVLDEAPLTLIAGSKTLLDRPSAVALDSHGNIYVANDVKVPFGRVKNFNIGRITVYAAGSAGNAKPVATISGNQTNLALPLGIALDHSDNIYVLNEYTAQGQSIEAHLNASVTVFPSASTGNASPSATISGDNTSLIALRNGIAVDSTGNIYTTGCANIQGTNGCFSINMYPPGSNGDIAPANAIFDIGILPNSIALDSDRNVYVLNQDSSPVPGGEILVYGAGSSGNATPTATITDNFTTLGEPTGIALDSAGTIYVADPFAGSDGNGSIDSFLAGSYAAGVPPTGVIEGPDTGLLNPRGVAVDSSGEIFALNFGFLTKYAPGSAGDAMPAAYFEPSQEAQLTGLAVSSRGQLYVTANAISHCRHSSCHPVNLGKILFWPARSDGSKGPGRVISGPSTGLLNPSAIAVDDAGKIYVTNQGHLRCSAGDASCVPSGSASVTVYGTGSSADAPPVATITGPHTGITLPNGIAIDPSGNIYVVDAGIDFGTGITQSDAASRMPVGFSDTLVAGRNRVLIFRPGSNGDVAPSGSIAGGFTGLDFPFGIAIGPTGN